MSNADMLQRAMKLFPNDCCKDFGETHWQVGCQPVFFFFFYRFFMIIYVFKHGLFLFKAECLLGNNRLLFPVSTVITMHVSGIGWVLCS